MPPRKRIQEFGTIGLMGGAVTTDIGRILLTVPFTIVPPVAIAMGFMYGLVVGIAYFFVYKFLFKVKFTERLTSRVICYFIGSGLPMGTTVATAFTIVFMKVDDRKYNRRVAIQNEQISSAVTAGNRALRE